jgi:hypothetical protein
MDDNLAKLNVLWLVDRAGRGILDTRISDELLYSGGGNPPGGAGK